MRANHDVNDEIRPNRTTQPESASPARIAGGGPDYVAGLQRLIGNAATVRLLTASQGLTVQRSMHEHGAGCDHGNTDTAQRSISDVLGSSSGSPLESLFRTRMEATFQADLAGVREYRGPAAERAAAAIGAKAFTVGRSIVYGKGGEDLETRAHELTHVVDPMTTAAGSIGGGMGLTSPQDRGERQAAENGRRIAAGGRSAVIGGGAPATDTGAVQRSAEAIVQRAMTARIRTKMDANTGQRLISEVQLKDRMPTNVSGGQGDHTVAEGLLRRVISKIQGLSRQDAFLVLIDLVDNSMLKNAIVERILEDYTAYHQTFSSMEGEDQNAVIEDLIQDYVRAANKRENTAFKRSDNVTTGGGNGVAEKAALKDLDAISKWYYESDPTPTRAQRNVHWNAFIAALGNLVDYKGSNKETAAGIILRAIVTACEYVPFWDEFFNIGNQLAQAVVKAGSGLSLTDITDELNERTKSQFWIREYIDEYGMMP